MKSTIILLLILIPSLFFSVEPIVIPVVDPAEFQVRFEMKIQEAIHKMLESDLLNDMKIFKEEYYDKYKKVYESLSNKIAFIINSDDLFDIFASEEFFNNKFTVSWKSFINIFKDFKNSFFYKDLLFNNPLYRSDNKIQLFVNDCYSDLQTDDKVFENVVYATGEYKDHVFKRLEKLKEIHKELSGFSKNGKLGKIITANANLELLGLEGINLTEINKLSHKELYYKRLLSELSISAKKREATHE